MIEIKNKIAKLKKNVFFNYTILFSLLVLFMISIFAKYGKWFIINGSNNDGLHQSVVNLYYFREILLRLIKTGVLSNFTWYIANGMDLYSNFAYFISGDIFSYLSVLVRTKDVDILYSILVVIRLYFVGITFLCYMKYKKINSKYSLIGALIYTFSTYVFYGSKHPYFINPVILFPLVMIGIEKIIKENKTIFYTIIIAVTFLANFYFAYPTTLITAIYGILLAIHTYKKDGFKKIIRVLLKTLLYSIIGIMISAVILLPAGISYFSSERTNDTNIYTYSISYYRQIMNAFLTVDDIGNWSLVGTQSIILITVPLFILKKRKEYSPIIILLFILFLPLLIGPIGSIFMGFNFPNNRWSYVFSFIFAFMTTIVLNDEYNIGKKELMIILIGFVTFLGIDIIFEKSLDNYTIIQIMLLFIWLVVLCSKDHIKNISKRVNIYILCLIALVIFGIGASIKYLYDIEGKNYVSSFSNYEELNSLRDTANNTIPDLNKGVNYIKNKDSGFYKIIRFPYFYENVALLMHFNTLGHYYSITPNNYAELNLDLSDLQYYTNHGRGEFDYRTKITTLLGVKYLINYNKNNVPYGYSKLEDYNGKSEIYQNNYYLPFGVLYNSYITEEEYNRYSALEKESSLMKTVALENDNITDNYKHNEFDYSNSIKEVDYKIINDNKIIKDLNNIVIKNSKNNTFEIEIGKVKNSEIYISFENFQYEPFDKQEMIDLQVNKESTLLDMAQAEKKYKWYQPKTAYNITVKYNNISKTRVMKNKSSAYYMDLDDFLFNLGYYDETSGTIKITLSKQGNYSFDDIKVYAVSMDDYEEDINNLRKSNFEATEWDNGYLKGKVNAETDGILQFQTMYNDGWKVYVDGKEVETLKSNKYFLGIEIDSGEHEIYMKYSTPYLKEGLVISFVGIGIFTTLCIYNKKKKKIV